MAEFEVLGDKIYDHVDWAAQARQVEDEVECVYGRGERIEGEQPVDSRDLPTFRTPQRVGEKLTWTIQP